MTSQQRRERVTIVILALCGLMTSLQFTLMVPALPEVPAALGVGSDDASWMVTATLLAGTVCVPVIGKLADVYGRRRLLLVSIALLGIGSVIAAVGMTFAAAIVGRSLQGMATAIVPVGIALIRDITSRKRANLGVALMSGTLGLGSALGLPLSGLLYTAGGLAAIFWFSAATSALFIVAVLALVPEGSRYPAARLDLVGVLLLSAGLTCGLLVMSKALAWGHANGLAVILLAIGGLLALGLWVPWELRHPSPVVDVRNAFSRQILLTNVASFFAAFGMFSNHFLTIQEARTPVDAGGLGLPPLGAGLILVPSALVMIVVAPVAARMLDRVGGRITLATGTAIIGLAYAARLVAHDGIVVVMIAATVVGVGTALAFAAMPTLVMDAVPARDAASATSVNSLVRSLSGGVASAVLAYLLVALPSAAGGVYLSPEGLMVAFGLTVVLSAAGTALALLIPRTGAHGRSV